MNRILQIDAAKIAGVSRARISQLAKQEPRPSFFVEVKNYDKPLVDIDSVGWAEYMDKRDRHIKIYTEEELSELIKMFSAKIDELIDQEEADKLRDGLYETIAAWEKGE